VAKKSGCLEVELPSGHICKIDENDKWILEKFPHWRININQGRIGAVIVTRYLKSEYGSVREDRYLHRIVMHRADGHKGQIDHRDRNPLNNTKGNLRWVNSEQNSRNSPKRSKKWTSQFRGVHKNNYTKCESWVAQIKVNGRAKHLGSFKTEKEAAIAYNEMSEKLYGEYGWLNDVGESK